MTLGLTWQESWVIMPNVRYEYELYEPMCDWLKNFLKDKYSNKNCEIITVDSHSNCLDSVLKDYEVIEDYPQTVGLQIKIDVLGIVKLKNKTKLTFIEAKKTALNLHDLGQLWAYCKLCNPSDAYLLSSVGLGSLEVILNHFQREDLLDFGDGKKIKKMKVGRWDIRRAEIDSLSVIPKI